MTLKDLISSPLEAGQSVLDAHRLPSHLDAALEYTARRLARKALSIDLVVIRRAYQLPHAVTSATVADAGAPSLSLPPRSLPLSSSKSSVPSVSTSASSPPSTSVDASALGLPANLVQRSREQNQVLFATTATSALSSTPSLVLRSLDHLYTFKAALCSYAQSGDQYRLEDAVDELRRYILAQSHHGAQQRRRHQLLPKRELLRQYPTLTSFSEAHLADINRMYSRAYGGPEHECGIEADGLSSSPLAVTTTHAQLTAKPKLPQLALDTTCAAASSAADADEEQTTPTAASAEASVEKTTTPDSLAWTSFLNISPTDSPLLLPLLGTTAERRNRFPRKMEGDEEKGAEREKLVDDDSISDVHSETSTTASSPPSLSSSLLSILSAEDDMPTIAVRRPKELSVVIEDSELPILGAVKSSVPEICVTNTLPVTILRPTSTRPLITPPAKAPSLPRALLPVLTLQTTFNSKPTAAAIAVVDSDGETSIARADKEEEEEEEEEQLTARPVSCVNKSGGSIFFGAASIGEMLQDAGSSADARSPDTIEPFRLPRLSRASILLSPVVAGAPQPPKTYEDISPITRSEWGFLIGDQTARQVTVTTF
ncbi:hypothetical protein SCUCBS95973_009324 [Sporothrix curviconia]|uniref:DUF7582 domain-containing protein n=1 Tax=Sporothrix curviconia TaxID=1260050 RepID=A0ABP0CVK8_9PEZI